MLLAQTKLPPSSSHRPRDSPPPAECEPHITEASAAAGHGSSDREQPDAIHGRDEYRTNGPTTFLGYAPGRRLGINVSVFVSTLAVCLSIPEDPQQEPSPRSNHTLPSHSTHSPRSSPPTTSSAAPLKTHISRPSSTQRTSKI